MLTLTRKSDYALVALTHLARGNRPVSSAREISEIYRIPLPILMNILKTLARHDMIASVRGAHGGYRLAMDARKISLHMIVHAIEGPVALFPCARNGEQGGEPGCEKQSWCPISAPARKVSDRLKRFLDEVTLAEIARDRTDAADYVDVNGLA